MINFFRLDERNRNLKPMSILQVKKNRKNNEMSFWLKDIPSKNRQRKIKNLQTRINRLEGHNTKMYVPSLRQKREQRIKSIRQNIQQNKLQHEQEKRENQPLLQRIQELATAKQQQTETDNRELQALLNQQRMAQLRQLKADKQNQSYQRQLQLESLKQNASSLLTRKYSPQQMATSRRVNKGVLGVLSSIGIYTPTTPATTQNIEGQQRPVGRPSQSFSGKYQDPRTGQIIGVVQFRKLMAYLNRRKQAELARQQQIQDQRQMMASQQNQPSQPANQSVSQDSNVLETAEQDIQNLQDQGSQGSFINPELSEQPVNYGQAGNIGNLPSQKDLSPRLSRIESKFENNGFYLKAQKRPNFGYSPFKKQTKSLLQSPTNLLKRESVTTRDQNIDKRFRSNEIRENGVI